MNESQISNKRDAKSNVEISVERSAEEFFADKWFEVNGVKNDDGVLRTEDYGKIFHEGIENMVENIGFDKIEKKFNELKARENKGEVLKGMDAWNRKHLQKSTGMTEKWKEMGHETLIDALDVIGMKRELDELNKQGDIGKVSERELEIVEKIKMAVGAYPQVRQSEIESSEDHPNEILKNQEFNCVGASIIGGYLLDKVGVKQLPTEIYNHATNIVITSNDKVYLADMRWKKIDKELNDDDMQNNSVNDILEFSESGETSAHFDFSDKRFSEIRSFWKEKESPEKYLRIRKSETGGQVTMLFNYLKTLAKKEDRADAALVALEYAKSLDSKNPQNKEYFDLINKEINQEMSSSPESSNPELLQQKIEDIENKYQQYMDEIGSDSNPEILQVLQSKMQKEVDFYKKEMLKRKTL
jgi:hypothetical protein